MKHWTRRDVLKTGIVVPSAAALAVPSPAAPIQSGQVQAAAAVETIRERSLLDFGWRFHFGHANDSTKDFGFGGANGGFQKTGNFLSPSHLSFDDADWKPLDLPHDWAIELPFQNDPALSSKGFYPIGRSYPETSVGWYRRVFELPAADAGKRISVEFDGAYRQSMVVFNGFYVGTHSGGYDPFSFDLTDFLIPGGPNVLLVRVDATLSDGWFYEGAGIYRHVWLVKTAPVHVKRWGTFARAELGQGAATVSIRTEVENHANSEQQVRVISTILDPSGREVSRTASAAQPMAGWGDRTFEQQATVRQPALWSLEEPQRYKLVTEVEAGGAITDRYETRFGIRSLRFDAAKGCLLNGKPVKVKGTCNHQDHAGLGTALPDAVQYARVRKLQEMGCNAYRTSHNPPTPELLDACDELGMLVLDETRMMSSNPEGLAQFANLVRRDRNHPSVFLWSMANEERESGTGFGLRILTAMKRVATEQDGSRPVTIAPFPFGGLGQGGNAVCDVMGYNYADPAAEEYHKANPGTPVIGTETVSAVGARGIYVTDPKTGFVSSYDPYTTTGRASAEGWWRFCNARPWLSGGFVWTGYDYRGEPSPYEWPNISSQYGAIDTCGFPKDSFFYYQSWWTSKPVLHLFPHWNWPGLEGREIAVWVHSNLERVELFHNGRSLGAKEMPKDSHLAWNVKYAPGTIEARGYRDGKQVLTARRDTTGPAAKLVVRANRTEIAADGEDVAMFAVEVHDAEGRVVPVTDNQVHFRVTGTGKLIGVGNGDPTSHESDIGSSRRAFSGMCMVIVQASKDAGSIQLEATSPGLTTAAIAITAKPVRLRPQIAAWEREAPSGSGVTGLWRPERSAGGGGIADFVFGSGDMVFTLRQAGTAVTGRVESPSGFFGDGGAGEVKDGRIDGSSISFRAGSTTYSGTFSGEQIELRRSMPPIFERKDPAAANSSAVTSRPAIGPPPDGTDPSIAGMDFGKLVAPPLILRRTNR